MVALVVFAIIEVLIDLDVDVFNAAINHALAAAGFVREVGAEGLLRTTQTRCAPLLPSLDLCQLDLGLLVSRLLLFFDSIHDRLLAFL